MNYRWMLYIVLLLSLGIGRLVERVLAESGGLASQYGPLLITVILSIGVYGSVMKQRIYKPWLWRVIYWASVTLSLAMSIYCVYLALYVGSNAFWGIVFLLVSLALLIPAQIQLKGYCFTMPK